MFPESREFVNEAFNVLSKPGHRDWPASGLHLSGAERKIKVMYAAVIVRKMSAAVLRAFGTIKVVVFCRKKFANF